MGTCTGFRLSNPRPRFCCNSCSSKPAPVAQSVKCPLRGTGGHSFDPGPRHIKIVKMVLAVPRLDVRARMVDPVSG